MEDRLRDDVDKMLSNAPLTPENVRLMVNLAVDRAVRDYFQSRSQRFWIWAGRIVPFAALLVGLGGWFN